MYCFHHFLFSTTKLPSGIVLFFFFSIIAFSKRGFISYKVCFVFLKVFLYYSNSWPSFSMCVIYRTHYIFVNNLRMSPHCFQVSTVAIEKLLGSEVLNNGWSFQNDLLFIFGEFKISWCLWYMWLHSLSLKVKIYFYSYSAKLLF